LRDKEHQKVPICQKTAAPQKGGRLKKHAERVTRPASDALNLTAATGDSEKQVAE
jgi:hypothetical protein